MMTIEELRTLLDEGKVIALYKNEKGCAVMDVIDQATYKDESIALDILINSLFEYGDILFDPDGPHGPSLIINNEFGTEISLTKKQAEVLHNAGVPCVSDMEEDQDHI